MYNVWPLADGARRGGARRELGHNDTRIVAVHIFSRIYEVSEHLAFADGVANLDIRRMRLRHLLEKRLPALDLRGDHLRVLFNFFFRNKVAHICVIRDTADRLGALSY